jgi:cell wall-associated NlpC family hydrolase
MRSFSTRQLFAATLLASAMVGLCTAHPLLSASILKSKPGIRYSHAARFEILRPSKRDSVVTVAWALIGEPYELGGNSLQRGFDCSGLVSFVLSKVQLKLPRTAKQQAMVGAPIDRAGLQPGDLLTFGAGTRVSHVGIYIGDGKFVHASSVAGRVVVSRIDRRPSRLIRPLSGARRLLVVTDSVAQHKGGG